MKYYLLFLGVILCLNIHAQDASNSMLVVQTAENIYPYNPECPIHEFAVPKQKGGVSPGVLIVSGVSLSIISLVIMNRSNSVYFPALMLGGGIAITAAGIRISAMNSQNQRFD